MKKLILSLSVIISAFATQAKTLVVYYSFTNNVHNIVTELSRQIDADVVRIEPAETIVSLSALHCGGVRWQHHYRHSFFRTVEQWPERKSALSCRVQAAASAALRAMPSGLSPAATSSHHRCGSVHRRPHVLRH